MSSVIFLGNSHLSSLRLATSEGRISNEWKPAFFCARGADLCFTKVIEGHLQQAETASADLESLQYFYPCERSVAESYLSNQRPSAPIARQFSITGGNPTVPLEAARAIFYVAGVSPYDFLQQDGAVMPVARHLRRIAVARMLSDKFLLRHQLEEIRKHYPSCKHYFVGAPLAARMKPILGEIARDIAALNREIVKDMAGSFLFDDVFQPDEELLDDSLLSTKQLYCRGGREESEGFQGSQITRSDFTHMNRNYGEQVLSKFVDPILSASSALKVDVSV